MAAQQAEREEAQAAAQAAEQAAQQAQELYQQNIQAFNDGTLPEGVLRRLPGPRQEEYLHRELEKKYNKPIDFSCTYCAMTALYNDPSPDGPYITDDEIIEATGFLHM